MKELRDIGPFLHLGWVVALSTLIPLGAGVALDRHFGTAPLLILIGALAGIVAGTVSAVRITSQALERLGDPDRPRASVHDPDRKENGA